MRKHPMFGVLALAAVLAVALGSGAASLYAGQRTVLTGANGECCVLVDGACVPCDDVATTAAIRKATAQFATARVIEANPATASAGCDPSNCVPMTPEECAAIGCPPAQCSTGNGCASNARMIRIEVAPQPTSSGCGGAPCVPAAGCGNGSGCGKTSGTSI